MTRSTRDGRARPVLLTTVLAALLAAPGFAEEA